MLSRSELLLMLVSGVYDGPTVGAVVLSNMVDIKEVPNERGPGDSWNNQSQVQSECVSGGWSQDRVNEQREHHQLIPSVLR